MEIPDETPDTTYSALDFFAGSGLVTCALKPHFDVIWANDISPQKAQVYTHNHGTSHFHLADINSLSAEDLPTADLSWASFPCQDLSLAGYLDGIHARRSGLVWKWLHLMDTMEHPPDILVAENVEGLVSTAHGENYLALHKKLSRMGYRAGAIHLNACRWVPQSRPRIFVIAVKRDITIPKSLKGQNACWLQTSSITNVAGNLKNWVWWTMPKPEKRGSELSDLIQWESPVDPPLKTEQLLGLLSQRHRELLSQHDRAVVAGYRRSRGGVQCLELRFDGLAGCLRTPKGGSSRQLLVLKQGDQIQTRLLTARETARLMGAPDSYWLPEGYNDAYMAMGDAVAVPAVQYLTTHLLAPLAQAVHHQRRQEGTTHDTCGKTH